SNRITIGRPTFVSAAIPSFLPITIRSSSKRCYIRCFCCPALQGRFPANPLRSLGPPSSAFTPPILRRPLSGLISHSFWMWSAGPYDQPRKDVRMRTSEIVRAWGKILRGEAPSLSIELTRECPLRCPGCYAYDEAHLGGGLTLRELNDRK